MSDARPTAAQLWQRLSTTAVRLFHGYANWLVGISWKRFVVLAVLLMILASVLQQLPPFRWTVSEELEDSRPAAALRATRAPRAPGAGPTEPVASSTAPASAGVAAARQKASGRDDEDDDVQISIDRNGVRITPRQRAASAESATPPTAAASASASPSGPPASAPAGVAGLASSPAKPGGSSIEITLPGATREVIEDAARAAREAARDAAHQARGEADDARRDADDARRDAREAVAEARRYKRTRVVHLGDSLTDLAFLFIVASAILKATYKARIQAEVKAAAATETAESEQLKRQVVEARMAAMQAQVEPHFLFNTLASIDHLIETDPPRASQMQKNLIALLRASMPTMRESHPTAHNLGREMAVIRPYLEILKVRMEDRLQTEVAVPDGLLSADFPPMMIQSLVENAIKHGLEPKAEGGRLTVRAEVIDGRLTVTVADTGLGFGRAATAGTGVGLANIRERLQLLYGGRAAMTVGENQPSGTVVTLVVPYQVNPAQQKAA